MSGLDNTSFTTRTVTGTSDTLLATDSVVIYTSTSAKAIAVPAVSSLTPGRLYTVINTATGAATITPSGATIDGAATYVVPATLGRVSFVNDGTNWFTVSEVVV
jgi:hypothetical protein